MCLERQRLDHNITQSHHCADKYKSSETKKKLSTHFKIQACYTKTYVLTNKAAEEILFLYNTKKADVFFFISAIIKSTIVQTLKIQH